MITIVMILVMLRIKILHDNQNESIEHSFGTKRQQLSSYLTDDRNYLISNSLESLQPIENKQ